MSGKKKTILIVALLLVVFIGSISYALWSVTLEQTDSNVVKTGCFTVDMVEQTDEINLPEEYPVTDAEGRKYSPFTFTIQNTCTIDSSYSVNLKVEDGTTLEHQYVKAVLDGDKAQVLTDYEKATDEDKYQLTTGTLAGASSEGAGDGESVTYNLRLWLDADTPETQMSKDFYAKIVIENITTSGAVKREVLATADISEAQDGSMVYNYYNTGELEITGSGRMSDTQILYDILGKLLLKDEFMEKLTDEEKEALNGAGSMATVAALTDNYHFIYMGFIGDSTPLCANEPTTYDEYKECLATAEFEGTKLFTDADITMMDKFRDTYSVMSSIKISEGVTNIGQWSLSAIKFEELVLPSTIEELADQSLAGADITNLQLNEGLKTIGRRSLGAYATFNEIKIPNTVTSLARSFADESRIQKIILPKNTEYTYIGQEQFGDLDNTTVIIPNTITGIDLQAFGTMDNLTLYFEASEEDAPSLEGMMGADIVSVNYNYQLES